VESPAFWLGEKTVAVLVGLLEGAGLEGVLATLTTSREGLEA